MNYKSLILILIFFGCAGWFFCTSAGISIPNADDAKAAKKMHDEFRGKLKELSLLGPGVTTYWGPGVASCKVEVYGLINPKDIETAKSAASMVLKNNSGVRKLKLIFLQNEAMELTSQQTFERNRAKEKIIEQCVLENHN